MKPVIEQLSTNTEFGTEFAVSHDFWTKISEAVDVLQIPYLATKQMQRNGYGLADFYISWLRMKRGLSRINNGELNLARQLDKALEERENLLLETPTMMLAMYLHPRVKNRLNNIQKECATIAAEKLHIRLTNVGNQSGANVSANDTLDELNAEVSGGYSNADNNTNAAGSNITLGQFRESIIKYDAVRPTDIKSNVFGFWKERKQKSKATRYDRKLKKMWKWIVHKLSASIIGVDLMDGLIGRYHIKAKSRDPMMRLFYHFVDMAATNAYILYRRINAESLINVSSDENRLLKLPEFREEIAAGLVAMREKRPVGRPSASAPPKQTPTGTSATHRVQHLVDDLRYDDYDHFPKWMAKGGRRICKLCKVSQTQCYCNKCKLHLCCSNNKNCFLEYHKSELE